MRKVYYGWYVVALAVLIYICVTGFTFGVFGVFVLPVSKDLMLSRADINTALIFKNLGNAVWAPVVGRLLDTVRAKPVMIACSLAFVASFIGLGLSHSLWLSAFIMGVGIPIAYLGAGSLSNTLLVARWFKARRGRAMMIAGTGTSLGTMIAPPLVGFLVEDYGWRQALIIIGVVIGSLLLVIGVVVREQPGINEAEVEESIGVASATLGRPPELPIGMVALLRTPHFWTMCLSTSMGFAANQAVIVSLVPLGQESGLSMLQAASLVSVLGGAAIFGGVCVSFVADKVDRVLLLTGLLVVQASVNGVLALDKSYPTFLVCAAILGVGSGVVLATFYALLADRFGTASFGTVRGTAFLLNGVLGMATVRFAGEVYDRTGGYNVMFLTFFVTCLLAALLMLASRFVGRSAVERTAPHPS